MFGASAMDVHRQEKGMMMVMMIMLMTMMMLGYVCIHMGLGLVVGLCTIDNCGSFIIVHVYQCLSFTWAGARAPI